MKEWVKRYGIHIGICALIVGITFMVNTGINTERSHIYTVSEPIYTILKEVTSVKKESGSIVFTGWGFDTNYYDENSSCELILQDTETGEAFWPKMEKNPEPVQIADRYTDGGDYSDAGFEGSLKENKLKENSVYEILLRYTSKYTDEAGVEQQYIRTVTTDEFLYQGQMTEYNPKTFVAPEIAGTELEKELEEARLFHYFPEGMWVYYTGENLFYIAEKNAIDESMELWLPCFWYVRNTEDLLEEKKEGKIDLLTYPITQNEKIYEDISSYRVWNVKLPSKHITHLMTGLYDNGTEKKWLLQYMGQMGEITNE